MTFTSRLLFHPIFYLLLLAADADLSPPPLPTFELHIVQRGGTVLSCGGSIRSFPLQLSSITTMNRGSNSYPLIPFQPSYMQLTEKDLDTQHTDSSRLLHYHHVLFPSVDECTNFFLERYTLVSRPIDQNKNSTNRIIQMSPHSPPLMQMFVRQEQRDSMDSAKDLHRAKTRAALRRKEAARAALESLNMGANLAWKNMSLLLPNVTSTKQMESMIGTNYGYENISKIIGLLQTHTDTTRQQQQQQQQQQR